MRLFTVRDAETLFPVLRKEVQKLRPAYYELKSACEAFAKEYEISPDHPKVRDYCLENDHLQSLVEQVESSLCLFDDLGVQCRGIERGLFDFPCIFDNQVVYLSWQTHEEKITHWHDFDSGHSSRRPLLEPENDFCTNEVYH